LIESKSCNNYEDSHCFRLIYWFQMVFVKLKIPKNAEINCEIV
jgi:hypothetical protein